METSDQHCFLSLLSDNKLIHTLSLTHTHTHTHTHTAAGPTQPRLLSLSHPLTLLNNPVRVSVVLIHLPWVPINYLGTLGPQQLPHEI